MACWGLSCVSFAAIGFILWFDGQYSLAMWCFAMIAAILPYILLNLGALGRRYKVFMGDAGSTLIGFTVIWILLETTQGQVHPISPVTALWIIAIPLMDMVAIMYQPLAQRNESLLSRPTAYSSFDHARWIHLPAGICFDNRGGRHPCGSGCCCGVCLFCARMGYVGIIFAGVFPVWLLH